MREEILGVLAANKARQDRARQLNIRAGEVKFPVLDRAQLVAWMTEKAAGARRMAEIADSEALRLPALDEAMIESVIRENPDEIECLGAMRLVVYAHGSTPKIRLDGVAAAENRWLVLPDEGVFLSGGRGVEVEISFGYSSTLRSANIPELKMKIRDYLNRRQWDSWPQDGRPEIPIPDSVDEAAVIPEITTVQYGQCVVTSELLLAYGALAPNSWRYDGDPYFEVRWCRTLTEAEDYRAKAIEVLEKERAAGRERRELETARQEAKAVWSTFHSLYDEIYHSSWSELPAELRSRLHSWQYKGIPSSLPEIRQRQAETEALIAEVEPALAEVRRQKEGAEYHAREEQEARERAEEARRVYKEDAHRGQMEEILAALKTVLGYVPEIHGGYDEVAGRDGTYLEDWGWLSREPRYGQSTAHCDGREAFVMRSVKIAGGVLEFLSYTKNGQVNLAARWRELSEAEVAQATEAKEVQVEDLEDPKLVEDLGASLAALRARFNR